MEGQYTLDHDPRTIHSAFVLRSVPLSDHCFAAEIRRVSSSILTMIDRVPLLPVNTRNPCFFALTISINLPSKNDPPLRDQTFSLKLI